MKNQKGFTLIELLLVLAIIGIISAIAIPALLSQRGRARDKAAITNMTGRVGDIIGQYDRLKEQGLANAAITLGLQTYITDTSANDKNPWDSAAQAFISSNLTGADSTFANAAAAKTAADALGAGSGLGVVKFQVAYPAVGFQGFVIGAVGTKEIQGQSAGTYATKVSAIE